MSEGPDAQKRPTRWEQAFQKEARNITQAKEAEVLLQQLQTEAQGEFRRAMQIDAALLSSLCEINDINTAAHRLAVRHEGHLISEHFIQTVLNVQGKSPLEVVQALQPFRIRANKKGFFLMQYSPELMRERLLSPSYVIAEAFGNDSASKNSLHWTWSRVADCQCHIPDSGNDVEHVIELPDQGDVVIQSELIQRMRQCPWEVAQVDDIATTDGWESKGFAGAARNCVFEYIRNELNPQRGEFPIRYVGAAVAQIKGVEFPDGRALTLQDIGDPTAITNDHSVIAHIKGRNAAIPAYQLVDRKVAVELDGQQYQILVNWFMFVHDLMRSS